MRLAGVDFGKSERAEESDEIMARVDRLWMKRVSGRKTDFRERKEGISIQGLFLLGIHCPWRSLCANAGSDWIRR